MREVERLRERGRGAGKKLPSACQSTGIEMRKSNFYPKNKIGSQKNRLEMGLREIESKMIFKFCGEKSDIEVYLPQA